jgi:hypothetical protein
MKRSLSILALITLVAAASFAADAPAPAADNAAIAAELQRTEARLLKNLEGLTEAQWNFKAAEDKWSIAQCVEHLASAEPMIRGMVAKATAADLTPEMLKAGARHDEALKTGLIDRTKKFKAPEPLQPSNKYGTPASSLETFRKERAETVRLAMSAGDLRTHGDNHFMFGALDAYGWFLFLSGHSERHTLQIEEVKADPNFPKAQ